MNVGGISSDAGGSCRYKECTGKSVENLEREKASKAVLQSQNKAQVEFNCELQDEVAQLRAQLAMSQTSNERQASRAADVEAKRKELEAALQAAEVKLREGELLRRKLHNTILASSTPFPSQTSARILKLCVEAPQILGVSQLLFGTVISTHPLK